MKAVTISPAAAAELTAILRRWIGRQGLPGTQEYQQVLLECVRAVARGEQPFPKPCEILLEGRPTAAGLCYCATEHHLIILREKETRFEVVEFVAQR